MFYVLTGFGTKNRPEKIASVRAISARIRPPRKPLALAKVGVLSPSNANKAVPIAQPTKMLQYNTGEEVIVTPQLAHLFNGEQRLNKSRS
jgi:hypothetical protein